MKTLISVNKAHVVSNTRGFSLIEVLVALLISGVAILGMIALQGRSQQAHVETLQRGQAMLVVDDIVNRISANVENLADYELDTFGDGFVGVTVDPPARPEPAGTDLAAWDDILDGAAETVGGNNAGGLIGARGCIDVHPSTGDGVPDRVQIMVSWQGTSGSTITPADLDDPTTTGVDEALNCGAGNYAGQRRSFGVWLSFGTIDTTPTPP